MAVARGHESNTVSKVSFKRKGQRMNREPVIEVAVGIRVTLAIAALAIALGCAFVRYLTQPPDTMA